MTTTADFPEILSLEDWVDQYKPIDAIQSDGSGLPYAGAIKGPDEASARAAVDSGKVWTVLSDENGDRIITEGFHFVNREAYILTEVARTSENPMLIPLDYELDDKLFSVNSKDGDEDDIEYIRAKSIDEARSHSVRLFGDENEEMVFVEVEKSLNEQAGKKTPSSPRP